MKITQVKHNLARLIFLFFTPFFGMAQSPSPLMFWRIDHPGQEKPSYLYATTSDNRERLFQFPDSLYHALHSSDVFTLIRSPRELLEFTIAGITEEKQVESALLKEAVSPAVWNAYAGRLQKQFGKPANQITVWDALTYSKNLKKYYDPGSPFHTEPETYLYEYARRKEKPVEALQSVLGKDGKLFIPMSEIELQWLANEAGISAQRKVTEQFVGAYLDGDLGKMMQICTCAVPNDPFYEQELNKVASSIDSLVSRKSSLIVLPVGYLLSSKNLLHHLQSRVKITPVTNSVRVSPSQFPLPPTKQKSTPVTDRLRNRFTGSIPGEFFERSFGNIMEMYVGMDIYEETSFFITSYPAQLVAADISDPLEMAARQFMEVKKLPAPKPVSKNGIKGLEYVITTGKQEKRLQAFRENEILVVAYMIRDNTAIPSSYKNVFFDELQILPAEEQGWIRYRDPVIGYSAFVPGPLKYDPFMSRNVPSDNRWNVKVHSFTEGNSGLLFLVTVTSAAADTYIANDSIYLADVKRNTAQSIPNATYDSMYRQNGRMTYVSQGATRNPGVYAIIKSVVRKNELLSAAVIYQKKQENDPRIGEFIQSFELFDQVATPFKEQVVRPGLATTVAPGPFIFNRDSSSAASQVATFNSRDTSSSEVYSVIVVPAANKQWYRNAGEYWEEKLKLLAEEEDSLQSQEPVINGEAEGYQVLLRSPRVDKYIRMLPFADSLVMLMTILQPGETLDGDKKDFFEAFRFNPPYRPPVLFRSRAQELLTDLLSTDSAVYREALDRMADAPFSIADIPALRKALLQHYPLAEYSTQFAQTPTEKISEALLNLGDPGIASFAMMEYPLVNNRDWIEQSLLLNLIARDPREETYRFIASQLTSVPADTVVAEDVFFSLCDNLDELNEVFPQLLPLIKHPAMQNGMLAVINHLLQADSIKPEVLYPYENIILTILADGLLTPALENDGNFYNRQYRAMQIAGLMATDALGGLLQRASRTFSGKLRLRAALDMLTMKMAPDPRLLEALAANPEFRFDMYSEMAGKNLTRYFPSKYARQALMAESLLWSYSLEDANPLSIKELDQRPTQVDGQPCTAYFFVVQFRTQEGKQSPRLGMAVFPADKQQLLPQPGLYEINWDEPFDPKRKEKMMTEMLGWLNE